MKKTAAFVQEHIGEDTARLILNRAKWPDIDIDLAVACIECRKKLKGKVQEWYDNPDLIFPIRLSAEQCSSSATAEYKAILAQKIAGEEMRLADLTGGLGVDSWFFAKGAENVLYNEMQEALCRCAKYNFECLEALNIVVSNLEIQANSLKLHKLLDEFHPDIIFLDPARRSGDGKKVFLIEDCTPDVLTLRHDIFSHCRHLLIKLSPMADIKMVCSRLGNTCREVHVVAYGGECKELLIWMDREWDSEYSITAVELPGGSMLTSDSQSTKGSPCRCENPKYLFEPGKSLMKAGFFELIRDYFGVEKMGISTHYYLTDDDEKAERLKMFGKVYKIISIQPLDKRTIKAVGKEYPRAEVSARNIPMDTDTLRKKLGVTSGDDAHIFGLKSDKSGNVLIVGKRN